MKKIVSAHTVLFNEDKVLIVRRSKTDHKRPLEWDLPGGILESGELVNDGCVRELEEETGIKIYPKELTLAYTLNDEFENKSVSWLLFVGRVGQKDVKLSYEHDKFKWVDLDSAIEMIDYPKYKEALTYISNYKLIP